MPSKEKITNRFAFVIPVYNHEQDVAEVVQNTLAYQVPIFVVNDGSTDGTRQSLGQLSGISILNHRSNQGKGAALISGFKEAQKVADWAITIDADGQHDPRDAKKLMAAVEDGRRAIVIGKRIGMSNQHVPWTSRFGRGFSNFWVWISGGQRISDSQSGFRLYPLPECLNLNVRSRRFQFEVEILVKAGWKKIPVKEVTVKSHYKPAKLRISHFKPFIDFLRNSVTFTRLIIQRCTVPPFIRNRW
jgi:glycosyltransferase involved in cell wall biosynthesis